MKMGEREDYEAYVERAKKMKIDISIYMDVIPVRFSAEHKDMLAHCKIITINIWKEKVWYVSMH
ncbi:MAG TPA: hypothetical protein VE244_04355 [Nitrososphaeraceae archaeon]|jgi:hypothetical protein|nr:hypothetical protein [Nitrososphaeraceae archaeon]